jgi:hypothetical protein
MILWLSTNSIPKAVKDADGFWATNLKHLGWENPPQELATTAADNIGAIIGILLLVVGVICLLAWLWEKCMERRREQGPPKPEGSGDPKPLPKSPDDGGGPESFLASIIANNNFNQNGIAIQINNAEPPKEEKK